MFIMSNRRNFLGLIITGMIASTAGCIFWRDDSKTGILIENRHEAPHRLRVVIRKTQNQAEVHPPWITPGPPNEDVWRLEKTYYTLQSGARITEDGYLDETGSYWILAETSQYSATRWIGNDDYEEEPYVIITIQENGRLSIDNPMD
jgi:hypothetical protein